MFLGGTSQRGDSARVSELIELFGLMAARALVQRRRGRMAQRFGWELLCRIDRRCGADVSRPLRLLTWRRVVPVAKLHVNATDGIVDAVLNVSAVTHDVAPFGSAYADTEHWRVNAVPFRDSFETSLRHCHFVVCALPKRPSR